MNQQDDALSDALATAHDAGAVRVPPWMALAAALASIRPDDIGASINWLVLHRDELQRAYADGRDKRLGLAKLPPAMLYQPELGHLDRPRNDHVLRERHIFADTIGKRTFFQTAIYAITGIELAASDAAMLEQIGNVNLTIDHRAWPLAATRRVAARGGGFAAAVVAGQAMMGAMVLAGSAAADCARFLHQARAAVDAGHTVADLVAQRVAHNQRVMGFGRPVVGPDERVPVMQAILARHGRDHLPFVTLLRAAEDAYQTHKDLRSNAAAWAAAILADLGMTPEQVHAVCHFWVSVCVYAQAVYSGERGLVPESPHTPEAGQTTAP